MRTLIGVFLICLFCACVCSAEGPDIRPQEDYFRGRFSSAIRYYKQKADLGDRKAFLDLAAVLKDLLRYDQASYILDKAARSFPQDKDITALRARLCYLRYRPGKAVPLLKALLVHDPRAVDLLTTLGLCYQDMGDLSQAADIYQKIIDLDPSNVIARLSLADVYCRKDDLARSRDQYKKISMLDASLSRIYGCWGSVLVKLGDWKDAFRVYEKLVSLEPRNEEAKQMLENARKQLGQDYFDREHEKKAAQRRISGVFVKPADIPAEAVKVAVGLVTNVQAAGFKCSVPFQLESGSGTLILADGAEKAVYTLSARPDAAVCLSSDNQVNCLLQGPVVIRPIQPEGTVTIFEVSLGKNHFWGKDEDRSYRGIIEVVSAESGLRVINRLSLEEYLYGVLPSEMPASWPLEALKSQAVAARSEALVKIGRHKKEGFDFCSEVHCQAYGGVERETAVTNQAVDQTRGMVMVYQGKPIDAVYSSNCGGHTQDNVFGQGQDIPYLRGVPDIRQCDLNFPLSASQLTNWFTRPPGGIYCDVSAQAYKSAFRWVRLYSQQELQELVRQKKDVGRIRKIIAVLRRPSGHIEKLKIIGSNSTLVLEKELAIRQALGNLRSSMFTVEVKLDRQGSPSEFVFIGGGWGHGVGMCQTGASGMARDGRDFQEILRHYYSGIDFKKLY